MQGTGGHSTGSWGEQSRVQDSKGVESGGIQGNQKGRARVGGRVIEVPLTVIIVDKLPST